MTATKPDKRVKLTEAQVTEQCTTLLRIRGFEPVRLNSALVTRSDGGRYRVGTPGIPDFVVLRPMDPGESECFWMEVKAPGKKPNPKQDAYHEHLRNAGFLVAVIDSLDAMVAFLDANYGRLVRRKA